MSEPVRRTVVVRCSVEHAFEVFTGRLEMWWPAGHKRIAGSRLRMEPKQGGRFYERTEEGQEADLGEVVRWEPPRRVTYTWYPGAISAPTEVDVRFSEQGDETLVEVIHAEGRSGMGEQWPTRAERFARAWDRVLPAYVDFVNQAPGGEPGPAGGR